MRAAMSLVALAARSASLRISSATTAKRTPDSPAPAASMAALSARRFVCDAISSIVSTISEISSERSPRLLMRLEMTCTSPRIRCMPARLSRTAPSPRVAASSVWPAAFAAEAALEATSCTERDIVSTSRLTVVASRACFSAPLAIWSLARRGALAGEEGRGALGRGVGGGVDVAEAVRGPLAAAAEGAPRDLGARLEGARDVLREVLARPLLLVALGLGGDLRTQPRD